MNNREMTRLLLILAALPLLAAEPRGYYYWSAGQLKSYEKELVAKVDPKAEVKIAGLPLASLGNYNFALSHRENAGLAEMHDVENDVFVVQSGEATLLIGGTMIKPQNAGKGQTKAKGIKGAASQKLTSGDVVHIPAKVPHQLVLGPGKEFTYFVIKIVQ